MEDYPGGEIYIPIWDEGLNAWIDLAEKKIASDPVVDPAVDYGPQETDTEVTGGDYAV